MNILINCEYRFDKNLYYIDSHFKNKILSIKDNKNIINEIKDIIKENDYVEFTKQSHDFIYIDDENNEAKKNWFIFRVFTKDYNDKKIYRGDLWVIINEIKDFDFNLIK